MNKNSELATHVREAYEGFLAFVDSSSEALSGEPAYESLQQVYGLASARMDALLGVLDEEREDIAYWAKELDKVEKSQDLQHWQDIAAELIEGGDYCVNPQEFKTWISTQVAELEQELTELLEDWRACVQDGQIAELAYLLEALADEQDDDDDDQFPDPFDQLTDEQEDDSDDQSAESDDSHAQKMSCRSVQK